MPEVTADEIRSAAQLLDGVVKPTPIESSRALEQLVGCEVSLKCESLQRTGSFKLRGAYNRIARLSAEERARGVVCASAGNHAQGVALGARLQDVRSVVFMPEQAPLPKVEATSAYGGEVRLVGESFDEALQAAEEFAASEGSVFVHPYDHSDVIAGQGTLGLEVLHQVPDVGTVVVPVGGGGLVSGVAVAVKEVRPDCRIVGVQVDGASSFRESLDKGAPTPAASVSTIADGIAVKRPGDLTFSIIQDRVDDVVEVDDESIARAVVLLLERAKLVVEPAGAAGVAAVMQGAADLDPPVVVVLSGGNIDPLLLQHLVTSGLTAEGRFTTIQTTVDDRPGELHRLLGLIADERANIVGVEHHRLGRRLGLGEVQVVIELETRGPDHVDELREALRGAGYPVRLM